MFFLESCKQGIHISDPGYAGVFLIDRRRCWVAELGACALEERHDLAGGVAFPDILVMLAGLKELCPLVIVIDVSTLDTVDDGVGFQDCETRLPA